MKTLHTTFEHCVHEWLLDRLHNQWRALGVPFSVEQPLRAKEAIDPEALFWCSLEFFWSGPQTGVVQNVVLSLGFTSITLLGDSSDSAARRAIADIGSTLPRLP
jgi:hypothetical protein